MLPAIAILIGIHLIVAANRFLGRSGMFSEGLIAALGGVARIAAGVCMIVARARRWVSRQHRHACEVLPPKASPGPLLAVFLGACVTLCSGCRSTPADMILEYELRIPQQAA